jgi:DNA/RNA endonuclease YhcR with UshA esterase domain
MLQKEEKITIVLMVMSLLVLIIIYFGFIEVSSIPQEYSDQSDIHDRVILHGNVVSKQFTYTGNHLILTVISNGNQIKVFIPENNGAAKVDQYVNKADTVEIIGKVDEYKGEREIIVTDPKDITIVE